jgi:hypothetical protein
MRLFGKHSTAERERFAEAVSSRVNEILRTSDTMLGGTAYNDDEIVEAAA